MKINIKDLHTYRSSTKLETKDGATFGNVITSYVVQKYNDVSNGILKEGFYVSCTQRVLIPSEITKSKKMMSKYPAKCQIRTKFPDNDLFEGNIVDYFPKTLNASVSTTKNTSDNKGVSSSRSVEHTSGSSSTNSNSYGVNMQSGTTAGISETGPSVGVSDNMGFDYNYTTMEEISNSDSQGRSKSRSKEHNVSGGFSMSIKDWEGYAVLDRDMDNQNIKWDWGQEFPWNALKAVEANRSGALILPKGVTDNLKIDNCVVRPSELSFYGVDLINSVSWIIYPKKNSPKEVIFNTSISSTTATHQIAGEEVNVSFNQTTSTENIPHKLDLELLSLDPIQTIAPNGAVIGFVKNKFLINDDTQSFHAISEANNLRITGKNGFSFSNNLLTADLSKSNNPSITIDFKIMHTAIEPILHIKHWRTTDSEMVMNIKVNGNTIENVHIDFKEGEGGQKNLSKIVLRNKDYISYDYCDYLVMGHNTITIEYSSPKTSKPSRYVLKAIALG